MKKKLEVITKVNRRQCYFCEGKGKGCKICGGTGIYEDKSYIFIYIDKTGQKNAFLVDSIK